MRKVVLIFLGIFVVFAAGTFLAGVEGKSKFKVIKVAVTILPLADFVENVGKEKVKVMVMVPPGATPHTYEPTPHQIMDMSGAKVYVKVGSGLDFELVWMDKLRKINKNMLICDSSKGIQLFRKDPHIWLSPVNAKIQVENIYKALVKVDPANREYYAKNRESYVDKLEKLDREIRRGLSGVKKRKFMVFHPAWGYFAREYNLEQIAVEREGKKPTLRSITELIKQAKEFGIKVIFVSPQFDVKSARVIAREINGRVVFIDPLAKDYIENMYRVLNELIKGLS